MCELAKALANHAWSMKIATFSTQDLQEQCCKSYVASYRVNKGVIGMRASQGKMFPAHVPLGMWFPRTHITRNACFPSVIYVSPHTFH